MADPHRREGERRDLNEVVERLLAEREALRQQRLGGLERVRALAASMDAALRALWGEGARNAALVAVGGYGRGELSPRSDIDLAIVYRGRAKPETLVKRLLYDLWDAGFEVGHGVRTVKDSLRLAAEDLEAHTAFLDARLVAGDASLYDDFTGAVDEHTRKRFSAFARSLAEATAARHRMSGDVPFLLEPNVKESAGGLRDAHVVSWIARYVPDAAEAGATGAHRETVHRIRSWLHDRAQRRADVLLLALQDDAGRDLGYDGERAGDALMRDYYATARAVWWQALAAIDLACGRAPAMPDASPYAAGEWSAEARRAFLATLRAGSAHALEALDQEGVVARLLPGWEEIRSRPQRNIYHRFTVDVHCFESVAQAVALGRAGGDDPLAAQVWNDLADPDRALLAALFHDAGKGSEEDHSVRGERLAEEWVRAMGLGDDAAAEVAWLVRNHLLLAETATRRETGDERLVESVAAQCGSAERLKMLYALTVADAKATGPEAWTPWKAALVAELFTKALHVLERGEVVGADADAIIKRRTAEVRDALAGHEPGDVDAHLLGMTRTYMLAFPTDQLLRHFALMHPKPRSDELRLNAVPAGEPGVYEVTFVARDRPGLFALVSGALAVRGVNIIGAAVFTRADGVALEVFRVVGAHDRDFDDARWRGVEEAARAALTGDIDLEAELADRRRAYARESKGKREAARVVVDNEVSDFATVVEVHATDRTGLLYDITHALAALGLDIQLARIATYGDDVVDAFYVRDLLGQRVTDAARVEQVEKTVLARIDDGSR